MKLFKQILITLSWAVLPLIGWGQIDTTNLLTADSLLQIYDIADSSDYVGNIEYFDYDWGGPYNGTYAEPYKTIEGKSLSSNKAYLFKRGAVDTITGDFITNADNILFGAYGTDSRRPEIYSTVVSPADPTEIKFGGDTITVRDLLVNTTFRFGDHLSPAANMTVFNCYINGRRQDGGNITIGIVNWADKTRFIGNKIRNMALDGIFFEDPYANLPSNGPGLDSTEIAYNYIDSVNSGYEPGDTENDAPGDGIQVEAVQNVWVHHNVVDRSDKAFKFCLIVQDKNNFHSEGLVILVEDNNFYAPFSEGDGGNGLTLEDGLTYLNAVMTIRRNKIFASDVIEGGGITGSAWGIVPRKNTNGQVYIYQNVVSGFERAIDWSRSNVDSITNHQNTFYDNVSTINNTADFTQNNLIVVLADGPTYFTDTTTNDFSLVAGSPAIDAGDATTLTTDIIGTSIPQGVSPDDGAYEYIQSGWCASNPITQSGVIVGDTVPPIGNNTGSVDVTASGANDDFSYSWSSGESVQDITDKQYGSYTLTITDNDSACVSIAIYQIPQVDTSSVQPPVSGDTVVVDTIKINLTQAGTEESGYNNIYLGDNQDLELLSGDSLYIGESGELGSPGYLVDAPLPDNVMQYYFNTNSGATMDFNFVVNDSTQYVYDILCMSSRIDFTPDIYTQFTCQSEVIEIQTDGFNDFATFSNKTPDENGDIIVYVDDGPSSNQRGRVNAFLVIQKEIVEVDSCANIFTIDSVITPNINNSDNGTITLTISGGATPYTYSWADGPTTKDRTGLSTAIYTLTTTDANLCDTVTTYTIVDSLASTLDTIVAGVDTKLKNWADKVNLGIDEYNTRVPASLETLKYGRPNNNTYQDWCTKTNLFRDGFVSITSDSLNYTTDTLGLFRLRANEVIYLEGITD